MALPCAQACINQEHIETSLAGLPAYLSGCRFLLVLAGPSYLRRLWCVVEARLLACGYRSFGHSGDLGWFRLNRCLSSR